MPYTTVYNAEIGIIETKLTGIVSKDVILSGLEDIMRLSLEHDCFLWLNDFSEAKLAMPITEIFLYAESVPAFLKKIGNKRFKIKRAIVRNDQEVSFNFFEDASVNRGVNTKIFVEPQQAKQWLLE